MLRLQPNNRYVKITIYQVSALLNQKFVSHRISMFVHTVYEYFLIFKKKQIFNKPIGIFTYYYY